MENSNNKYLNDYKIAFSKYNFHPIVKLPPDYEIYDFSKGYDENRILKSPYGIGKYNEKRPNMYVGDLYSSGRNIHIGIDIGAPVGTPIYAFYDGIVFMKAYNDKPLDYGYTIITQHELDGVKLFVLYGHLSKNSYHQLTLGARIQSGDVLGWIGNKNENGGWNPHVHIQLCFTEPSICDMPGVVSENDLAESLKKYPDPRLILGAVY